MGVDYQLVGMQDIQALNPEGVFGPPDGTERWQNLAKIIAGVAAQKKLVADGGGLGILKNPKLGKGGLVDWRRINGLFDTAAASQELVGGRHAGIAPILKTERGTMAVGVQHVLDTFGLAIAQIGVAGIGQQ